MRLAKLSSAIIAAALSSTAMAEPIMDRLDSNMTRGEATAAYKDSGKGRIASADFGFYHHYGPAKDQWANVYVVFDNSSANSRIKSVLVKSLSANDASLVAASITAKHGQPSHRSDVSKFNTPGYGIRQDDTETTIEWETDAMVIQMTTKDNNNGWRVIYRMKEKLDL